MASDEGRHEYDTDLGETGRGWEGRGGVKRIHFSILKNESKKSITKGKSKKMMEFYLDKTRRFLFLFLGGCTFDKNNDKQIYNNK